MFRHLIIPLDGSKLAEAALPPAAALASALSAKVTLAHLIERGAPEAVHGERHLRHQDEATHYLADVAQRFFPKEIDVTFHVHAVGVESVAEGIVEHACDFACDLVVMCTHGRKGLRRAVLGSIAQRVLASGGCPVLLVRPAGEGGPVAAEFRRIMAALDNVPEHMPSIAVAAALAKALPAALNLLTVVPTLGTLAGAAAATGILLPTATTEVLEIAESSARSSLEALARNLLAEGIQTSISIRRGDPAEEIAEGAREQHADLVVLATHGRAGMNAFWSGSVAPRVPALCSAPLLFVPVHDA
jgi:nucleotide-binding universal stress UspA family protein